MGHTERFEGIDIGTIGNLARSQNMDPKHIQPVARFKNPFVCRHEVVAPALQEGVQTQGIVTFR